MADVPPFVLLVLVASSLRLFPSLFFYCVALHLFNLLSLTLYFPLPIPRKHFFTVIIHVTKFFRHLLLVFFLITSP